MLDPVELAILFLVEHYVITKEQSRNNRRQLMWNYDRRPIPKGRQDFLNERNLSEKQGEKENQLW